jgi:hypothetical protein
MPSGVRRVERVAPRVAFAAAASLLAGLGLLLACGDAEPEAHVSRGAERFDGARAFADLRDLVAIGPRPSGSPGAERTRQLIRERLRQAGWRVEEHDFEVVAPNGRGVEMRNLIGVLPGRRPERVLGVTHYDTKQIPGVRFVGANDGASGVAVLLEVARQLGSSPREHSHWLVFFDGEEAFGPEITADDGLYGSRALAERMQEADELGTIRALVLVDMVGDADLNLTHDLGSSSRLRRLLYEVARDRGLAGVLDGGTRLQVVDDHTPFARRGVQPVLALIDFQYGARVTPGPFWHRARDDLSAVSAESLNSVGTLTVELLERLDDPATDPRDAR